MRFQNGVSASSLTLKIHLDQDIRIEADSTSGADPFWIEAQGNAQRIRKYLICPQFQLNASYLLVITIVNLERISFN